MYLDFSTVKTSSGKSHTRILLRESYREDGKVKKRTLANLTHLPANIIRVIKEMLGSTEKSTAKKLIDPNYVNVKSGLKFGALYVLYVFIKRLKILEALGKSREALLVVWLICARILFQGSRLKAARMARQYAIKSIIGVEEFNENHLYKTLKWVSGKQTEIENYLMKQHGNNKENVFLYDVTSCYFEGADNALSDYGYNRDGKKGKKQIVIGLLTDKEGEPLSIEVFPGNTSDPKTCSNRIDEIKKRFGANSLTLVGDRGMIKEPQIGEILSQGWNYITAITKAQMEALIREGVFQLNLFDEELHSVCHDSVRYVLKRNPKRAAEIRRSRREKVEKLIAKASERTKYLQAHSRAKEDVAHRRIYELSKKLQIDGWTEIEIEDRNVKVVIWGDRLKEESKLDGCYVIKSNIVESKNLTDKQMHDRYKDLKFVEWSFRTIKTALLENRPIYCRLEEPTRAVCFISMLAYKVIREIVNNLKGHDEELLKIMAKNNPGITNNQVLPIDDIIRELDMIQETSVEIEEIKIPVIQTPSPLAESILDLLNIKLPSPKAA